MPAVSVLNLPYVDHSNEKSSVAWNVLELNALNYGAIVLDGNDVRTAISAISLCNESNLTVSAIVHAANGAIPADVHAQRELALRVFYTDNVNGRKGHLSIPGPDLTLLQLAGDEVGLADNSVMEDLVVVMSAGKVVSRDGNFITVTGARIVGRNS